MKYDCFNKCWSSPIILFSDLLNQTFHLFMTESEITKTRQYLSNKLHNQLAMCLLSLISETGLPMHVLKAVKDQSKLC